MKIFGASIPIGLGDLIYIKGMFDPIKHEYSKIYLNFHRELITKFDRNDSYNIFLDEIGQLLFAQPPYQLVQQPLPYCSLQEMSTAHGLVPYKPNLSKILCQGIPLNGTEPYIVINTKVRAMQKSLLESKIRDFWYYINMISNKYKIVILGERVVEMNQEYQLYTSEFIYSLYSHIYNNIPSDRLIDLTVPSLGITTPNISNIKQDCLIMNKAKYVINFGIGGGFCMATAVANTIAYRYDDDFIADVVFDNKTYDNTIVTKDWNLFIDKIKSL